MEPQALLLVAAVICVVIAIIGGGLKGLGAEVPLVKSGISRILLAGFGLFLLVMWLGLQPEQRRTPQPIPPGQRAQILPLTWQLD